MVPPIPTGLILFPFPIEIPRMRATAPSKRLIVAPESSKAFVVNQEEVEVFRLTGTIGKAAPLTGTYLNTYLVKL